MILGTRTSRFVIALLVGAGCSSPTEPARPPTLHIANPLCDSAGCKTIQVRAFVWDYKIPQNPIGLEVIGEIAGPTACLEFPDSWRITVSEEDFEGNAVRSDTITSTLDGEIYLTVLDWDPLDDLIVAQTETFVPGSAQGWTLAFVANPDPQASIPFSAQLANGPRCAADWPK